MSDQPLLAINQDILRKISDALAEMVRALRSMTFPEMPVIATWHTPYDYEAALARLTERPVDRARRLHIDRWQRRRARREHRKAPR